MPAYTRDIPCLDQKFGGTHNGDNCSMKYDHESNINANIVELRSGIHYRVSLKWLPRIGDKIDFQSFVDMPIKRYEVVDVCHEVRDIVKDIPQSHGGFHYPTVRVKRITAKDTLSVGDLLSMLTRLALALNETIDVGKHEGIAIDRIHAEMERGTLFRFLAELPATQEALKHLETLAKVDANVHERILAEWQGFVRANDFRVARDGLCQLLGYVIGSIRLRSDADGPWPESVQRVP